MIERTHAAAHGFPSELIPLRRRRRFVSRSEFAATSRSAPEMSPDAFRADQDTTAGHEPLKISECRRAAG